MTSQTIVRTEPVFGNESYTSIATYADQVQSVNIANSVIQNLLVDSINSRFIWSNPSPLNVQKLLSVTGYSSTSYQSMTIGESQFLNSSPGQPSASTIAGGILSIPANATLVGAYAVDETLAGIPGMVIGTKFIDGQPATASSNLFGLISPAILNQGTQVTAQPNMTTARLGSPGLVPTEHVIVISNAGARGVTFTLAGGPITATSGLKVTIFYLPTPPPGSS